jgi:hypothetical protein
MELFARQGFNETTVDEVAEAAGISLPFKSGFWLHRINCQSLLSSIAVDVLERWL